MKRARTCTVSSPEPGLREAWSSTVLQEHGAIFAEAGVVEGTLRVFAGHAGEVSRWDVKSAGAEVSGCLARPSMILF